MSEKVFVPVEVFNNIFTFVEEVHSLDICDYVVRAVIVGDTELEVMSIEPKQKGSDAFLITVNSLNYEVLVKGSQISSEDALSVLCDISRSVLEKKYNLYCNEVIAQCAVEIKGRVDGQVNRTRLRTCLIKKLEVMFSHRDDWDSRLALQVASRHADGYD